MRSRGLVETLCLLGLPGGPVVLVPYAYPELSATSATQRASRLKREAKSAAGVGALVSSSSAICSRNPARLVGLAQQFEKAKLCVDQGDFDARFEPSHRVGQLQSAGALRDVVHGARSHCVFRRHSSTDSDDIRATVPT